MIGDNKESYNSVEDFLESDELWEYREEITSMKKKPLLEEEVFDISSINFMEIIKYPISWGIDKLDKELWWQPNGKYMMLYGWAGSGKTTLTLQIAEVNGHEGNHPCYLSFEMPKKDFVIQNMRSRAWIKQSGVGESLLPTPDQQRKMKEFISSIEWIEIKWYVSQPSMDEFKSIMESLIWTPHKQVIIDNLWMIWRWDWKDEMQLYWEISAYVKDFCDRSNISVIMLHHTNKGSEAWNGKRWFSAFRGNWKLADDCDYVVQLEREFKEEWLTQSRIKIEKDRISGRNWYTLDLEFESGIFKGDVFG